MRSTEEALLAASWSENFKFWKELCEMYGGEHPRSLRQQHEVNSISEEMRARKFVSKSPIGKDKENETHT